ncbi:MAG TPA: putative Na+/H+ antiporter [Chthoniobacterales bacterium]|nr:putative Na+/H+ antiporter [Chthoniobacterales bacterium]
MVNYVGQVNVGDGQSILASRFGELGISPLYLFLGALVPTLIDGAAFLLFP